MVQGQTKEETASGQPGGIPWENKLARYLEAKLPGAKDMAISNLIQTPEGLSYDTYTFTASWRHNGQPRQQGFALRMQPASGPCPPYDVEPQYRILAALQDTDVPVPRVYWLEKDPGVLGMPFFVMEKVEGEVPLPWRSAGSRFTQDERERGQMARDFLRVIAALHNLDWKAKGVTFLTQPHSPTDFAESQIRRWEATQQQNEFLPEPILAEASGWLKTHIPPAPHTTIVHGDFRVGNFIWRDGRIAAFLDWELVGLGDPISDVAWVCMRVFRGKSPLMCGLLEREELYHEYERLTGITLPPESVHFWEIMGYVKLSAIMTAGMRAHIERMKEDIRLSVYEFDTLHHLNSLAELLGF